MAPFGMSLFVAASRKTHVFGIQKMKNVFFCETSWNLALATLFSTTRWRHVPNLGILSQTIQ
jgi:hypothetical protein